jgi:hypothetical protein
MSLFKSLLEEEGTVKLGEINMIKAEVNEIMEEVELK